MPLALGIRPDPAGEPRELARFLVEARFLLELLGDPALLVGRGRLDQRVGLVGLRDARGAVDDEGGRDLRLVEQQLGLEQFELEADRAQVLAQQNSLSWKARR
jgi:hypothetical protein